MRTYNSPIFQHRHYCWLADFAKDHLDHNATVELAKPTPNPRFNRLLLETLRNWRFFPAMQDGKPVASTEEVAIRIDVK